MAHDGDALSVNIRVALKIIQRAGRAPGDGGDDTPLVGLGEALTSPIKQALNAVQEFHFVVPNQVALVHGYVTKTAFEDFAQRNAVAQKPWPIRVRVVTVVPGVTEAELEKGGGGLS